MRRPREENGREAPREDIYGDRYVVDALGERHWLPSEDAPITRRSYPAHTEPCGCVFVSVDVPDDQWIGQGWRQVFWCESHVGLRAG